jgi:hypothetical protein
MLLAAALLQAIEVPPLVKQELGRQEGRKEGRIVVVACDCLISLPPSPGVASSW